MARRPISLQDLLAATTAVSVTFGAATSVNAAQAAPSDWGRGFAVALLIVLTFYGAFTALFCLTHGWRNAWRRSLKVVAVAFGFVMAINVWVWAVRAIGG